MPRYTTPRFLPFTVPFRLAVHHVDGFHGAEESMPSSSRQIAGRPGAVVLLPYANGCASQMASNARSSWKGLYGGERWITIARRSMPSRSASSGTPPQWGMAAGEGTRPTTGRRSKSSRSTSSRFPVTGSLKMKIGHIVLVLWPKILWLDFPRAIGPFQDRVELGYISFIEARVNPVGEVHFRHPDALLCSGVLAFFLEVGRPLSMRQGELIPFTLFNPEPRFISPSPSFHL
ncbi:uncharacterized protein LOC119329339 isoform X2 [Triticum dicoccoides]|uniref:uncharacterized protein LOC119329339 isoform X2 n=1 Tax=Triticum dicoccoides TaxID=85692 RepID=UPI001890FA24|nr:uncharacterized protein LOC119329339 isoform X2 [Triticum dicoccoides]